MLFPGQGSQYVGMGDFLWESYPAAREVFREAEDRLGWDLRALCSQGPPDRLTRTDNAQVAIFVTSVATWAVLREAGLEIAVALGHSLGEYSALVAVGHLSFADALGIVRRRGQAMRAAGERVAGTMAAVVGLDDDQVDELCRELGDVWPANYNSPGQVVVSGTPAGVARAADAARARGAKRVIPLPVSGAFHSPLVAEAGADLAQVLGSAVFGPAQAGRFFSTTEVRYPGPEELSEVLLRQLTSPVRFSQSMQALAEAGFEKGLEVGPGGVLAGLAKRVVSGMRVSLTGDGPALAQAISPRETR